MIIINGLIIYATIGIGLHLISVSAWKYWSITFFILPNVSITIIPNIFYGFMLTINYYYRMLNEHLRNIKQELNKNNRTKIGALNNRKYFFMKQSCHFSDEIDQLSILYQEVTTCTIMVNRIFSIQLMLFMAFEICVLISKLFIIYIIFVFEVKRLRTSQFNYEILWYNLVVFVVAFWTISALSHSCHATMKEVNQLI